MRRTVVILLSALLSVGATFCVAAAPEDNSRGSCFGDFSWMHGANYTPSHWEPVSIKLPHGMPGGVYGIFADTWDLPITNQPPRRALVRQPRSRNDNVQRD